MTLEIIYDENKSSYIFLFISPIQKPLTLNAIYDQFNQGKSPWKKVAKTEAENRNQL